MKTGTDSSGTGSGGMASGSGGRSGGRRASDRNAGGSGAGGSGAGGSGTSSSAAGSGMRLRLARQARGFSQQQLAGMAAVSRQAVSAVEAGHSDPSLRVALAVARALGTTVEELFGPGELPPPVNALPVAPLGREGARVTLAPMGEAFVALPLAGATATSAGFLPAGGVAGRPVTGQSAGSQSAGSQAAGSQPAGSQPAGSLAPGGQPVYGRPARQVRQVRPIGPPRPTLVLAGCDPAMPLLETPLALLDPPVAFTW